MAGETLASPRISLSVLICFLQNWWEHSLEFLEVQFVSTLPCFVLTLALNWCLPSHSRFNTGSLHVSQKPQMQQFRLVVPPSAEAGDFFNGNLKYNWLNFSLAFKLVFFCFFF